MAAWLFLAAAAPSVAAPPLAAPELTINGGAATRFEFARIPELVLVRGIAQVVQLGYYQIDPTNPWPAGDVGRAGGWSSHHATRLVDAATGAPVTQFGYGEGTGELTYNGVWSGDATVRIRQVVGTVASAPFRIRAIAPTVAYGDNVAAIAAQRGWTAKLCPADVTSFAQCRQRFAGGISDVAPLVIYIAPGTYAGQDWYLGGRRYVYVVGDPATRPTLIGDDLAGGQKSMFYVANLTLRNAHIMHTGALAGYPNTLIVRSVYQCCETRDRTGLMNPNTGTGADVWSVYWHASESRGMGGVGNTTHPAYIEGRPNSIFDVNNLRMEGSRGSSGIKTTMAEVNIRHSLLQVAETLEEIADGVCIHPGASTGCLMHTPVDFPGYSAATVYANRFIVWRGRTSGVTPGRSGVLAGTVFIRNRANSLGSDTPNYPNVSWSPPVSSQGAKLQGFCNQWSPGAATFVADQFWRDVRAVALTSEANPCLFRHFIGLNTFVQVPGSLPVIAIRDDGTYPNKVTSQFATTVDILRNHPLWAERSTTWVYGNRYEGFGDQTLYRMDREPNVRNVSPLSYWPRDPPDQYPRVVEVPGEEVPPWFKL